MFEDAKLILIVDDDKSTRIGLRKILEKAGYRVDTAENGQTALQKAQSYRYDAFLIDIKLPDIDGAELLLKLPKNEETVKIVITGFSNTEEGIKAADHGADDYLVKPIQPNELLNALRGQLRKL